MNMRGRALPDRYFVDSIAPLSSCNLDIRRARGEMNSRSATGASYVFTQMRRSSPLVLSIVAPSYPYDRAIHLAGCLSAVITRI